MTVDVVVIGGGLAGATTLYQLASRGVESVLVEAGEELSTGASFANGSMLTPSMADPWNGPGVGGQLLASLSDPQSAIRLRFSQIPDLALWGLSFLRNSSWERHRGATVANHALAQYSLEQTLQLERDLDLGALSTRRGSMKIFATEAAMARPLKLSRLLEGLPFDVLDADGAVAVEPALTTIRARIACAIHYPNDAVGDARLFVERVAAAARQAKAEVRLRQTVGSIRAENGGFRIELDGSSLRAKRLVLAAGSATPALARKLGVRLPIKPAKGYSLTYALPAGLAAPQIPVVDDAMHAAVVPLGDRIRVAGTAEFAGYDQTVESQRVDNLATLLARLYPDLAPQLDAQTAQGWAGLRPMSADGRPFIGETSWPGLWINAGHGHLGWTMAAGSARLLADLMEGCATTIDPRPYALGRDRL
jgi:D-amino-acid dehydrogenase